MSAASSFQFGAPGMAQTLGGAASTELSGRQVRYELGRGTDFFISCRLQKKDKKVKWLRGNATS